MNVRVHRHITFLRGFIFPKTLCQFAMNESTMDQVTLFIVNDKVLFFLHSV